MKWLGGKCLFFLRGGNAAPCSVAFAYVSLLVTLERKQSDYRLTFDFFFFLAPRDHDRKCGATTMADSFCLERGGVGVGC